MSRALAILAGAMLCAAPAVSDELTAPELEALANSIELRELDLPFLDSPRPDRSMHVTMADGVRLAVSIYFPDGFDPEQDTAGAVFEDSVYGRQGEAGTTPVAHYTAAGYVVVIGDARGYAASFGFQQGFNSSQQTADEATIIDWIAAQPWSNGKVAAIGHSVSAVFADSMTGSGASALIAAVIRASDFDEYAHNMFPGGVPNASILSLASELMDWHAGGDCRNNIATCANLGFAPVDGDRDLALLQAAIAEHQGNLASSAFAGLVYRDDAIGGMTIGESGAMARLADIVAAGVPARVSASWMDGVTALGALTRFQLAGNLPMEVFIGATSHAGGVDADPFGKAPITPAIPTLADQVASDIAFIDQAMAGESTGRSITYAVLGTDRWMTTDVWPPADTKIDVFSLEAGVMSLSEPASATATHTVDPTTTTGPFNRWAAQRGGMVYYGDARDASAGRMIFDGPFLDQDRELVGAPELCLVIQTNGTDGIVIAYLEDVAPDGRVTYLTEGMLRLVHRETEGAACDPAPGTLRSYARVDGALVTPGEVMQLEIPLLPVSALIRQGHRLRLSLAGADAGWFPPMNEGPPPDWTVHFGGAQPVSALLVPSRLWVKQ